MQKSLLNILIYTFDTFGMTLIEAEAAGLPSLFVDEDMKEILPPNGYCLADGTEAEDIAKALNDLLEHPERIKKMSEILVESRPRLNIKYKIDALEKIFKELNK